MEKSLALYAVFGKPIGHSLSPLMHNCAFRECGYLAHYLPVECSPRELAEKLEAFRQLGGRGVNLTRPLKEQVLPLLVNTGEWVDASGAANTLYWTDQGWAGQNTDCAALDNLLPARAFSGGNALIVGGGGVARATAAVLRRRRMFVVVAMRRPQPLTWADAVIAWNDRLLPQPWDVVVNATPLGQIGENQEAEWPLPSAGGMIVEWVYHPRDTLFVQAAKAHNIPIIDGLTLLVEQAALAWRFWFGHEAPREVMWEAIQSWSHK